MREGRQRNVALILARELAVNVSTPMWVWDEEGTLVYLNEQAEAVIGRSHRDLGVLRLDELPQFEPEELDGSPIDPEALPSAVAVREGRPCHRLLRIVGMDGVRRTIEATAIPLFARGDELVGAVSVFWELGEDAQA